MQIQGIKYLRNVRTLKNPGITVEFFKSQLVLQSVVIHLTEYYGEEVLQCLGKRPSVGRRCET
jgi:hypothetical protein